MAMQQTSLEAFEIASNNIETKRKIVYEAIKYFGEASDKMLSRHLGWEINRVTPRRNELVKLKKIYESRKGICPITLSEQKKQRKVIFWRCVK